MLIMARMHDDEIAIDEELVKRLLCAQFPKLAHRPIAAILSAGTDNAIFRLGDICVRLPRVESAARNIDKQQRYLARLAPSLPLPIPVPLHLGVPSDEFPWHWSICPWLDGDDATKISLANNARAAIMLADFLKALQSIDASDGPISRRTGPLYSQEGEVETSLASLQGQFDTTSLAAIWNDCMKAAAWSHKSVWTHGDLLPTNLLVNNGELCAVLDFDLMGVGDPACDMIAAWSVFTKKTRSIFRERLAVDEATWQRGRGWALSIALIIIPYYYKTNPRLAAVARRIINEILAD